jgi:hypothetical protein
VDTSKKAAVYQLAHFAKPGCKPEIFMDDEWHACRFSHGGHRFGLFQIESKRLLTDGRDASLQRGPHGGLLCHRWQHDIHQGRLLSIQHGGDIGVALGYTVTSCQWLGVGGIAVCNGDQWAACIAPTLHLKLRPIPGPDHDDALITGAATCSCWWLALVVHATSPPQQHA